MEMTQPIASMLNISCGWLFRSRRPFSIFSLLTHSFVESFSDSNSPELLAEDEPWQTLSKVKAETPSTQRSASVGTRAPAPSPVRPRGEVPIPLPSHSDLQTRKRSLRAEKNWGERKDN